MTISLTLRRALYFKYATAIRLRITPAPTCIKEVDFIYSSFKKIAPIEYFNMQQTKESMPNRFRRHATIVLNSWEQLSQLNPMNGMDTTKTLTSSQLMHNMKELQAYLKTICGLPRFSYVENDSMYMEGKSYVPFKHTLVPEGRHLEGDYEISHSTIKHPFFTLNSPRSQSEVLPYVRHNFQKAHKLEVMSIDSGNSAIRELLFQKTDLPNKDPEVSPNATVALAAILNPDAKFPIKMTGRLVDTSFNGFRS